MFLHALGKNKLAIHLDPWTGFQRFRALKA